MEMENKLAEDPWICLYCRHVRVGRKLCLEGLNQERIKTECPLFERHPFWSEEHVEKVLEIMAEEVA